MSVPALAKGIRFRRTADGQGVLLIPEGLVNLNESAAAIVEQIDGMKTVAEIAANLCVRYQLDEAVMRSDIEALLERFAAHAWLESEPAEKR